MMTIGEFALHTGISVKALRFYDERGILPPAEVDRVNGYRFYAVGQLRVATIIRALRASRMPLESVTQVLDEADRALDLLAAHQDRLQAKRALEDRAVCIAEDILAEVGEPTPVEIRKVGPTRWVGVTTTVRPEDGDTDNTGPANRDFDLLQEALQQAGNPPSGGSWTGMAPTVGTGEVEVLQCWPVSKPVTKDFAIEGVELRTGTLPERTEAFVRVDDVDKDLLDEAQGGPLLHPSYLAFVDYLEQEGHEPRQIRQGSVLGDGGTVAFMELSATLAVEARVS